jgi:hypothetical protein
MRMARQPRIGLAFGALYALVTLLLGFVHAHSVARVESAGVANLILPNGLAVVICGSGAPHQPADAPDASAGVCDACLLYASPGLIAAAAEWDATRPFQAARFFIPEIGSSRTYAANRWRSPRGPPTFLASA